MDITSVFKECVTKNKTYFKELDSILGKGEGGDPAAPKNGHGHSKSKVFPGKKSEHFTKAKDISSHITKLRNYLKESRTAYVNVATSKHVSGNSAVFTSALITNQDNNNIMTDKERDQLDNDVQMLISNCQRNLMEFQNHVETSPQIQNEPQLRTHLENVANSLSAYLKRVTEVYSEMRAIRVKRTVDYQAMSKLASHPTSSRALKSSMNSLRSGASTSTSSPSSRKRFSDWDGPPPRPGSISSETDGNSVISTAGSNLSDAETPVPTYFQDEDDVISPEELQILEQENAALLNELNTLSQEVEQVESSVVQIAQLQEIFTEKVLLQEKDIDRIGNLIVNTTENIKGGNEQVRQAIQNSADFRAWVLFFIMVMSFSLLFLDWYNE